MGMSAIEAAKRLADGETINRVDMPDLKCVLIALEGIQHNAKGCIRQIKKELNK